MPAARRAALAEEALGWADHIALGWASAAEIDRAGLNAAVAAATSDALRELLEAGVRPQIIYSDGTASFVRRSDLHAAATAAGVTDWDPATVQLRHQVRLDATSVGCAAASLHAKVTRDAHMAALADTHRLWGFERHAGYGTAEHRDAIATHGTSEEHRATFCAKILAEAAQLTLTL